MLSGMYITNKSVLPMRFCEKVGFFSGTDKATAEGGTSLGGSGGMLPRKIFENCKANRAILQHLGKNSLFFSLLKIDMFKVNLGIKELLYIFFPYVLLIYIARHFIPRNAIMFSQIICCFFAF